MIICTYDISNTKLRTQFSKTLEKYGRRLQYSVFEINNSPRVLNNVTQEIEGRFRRHFEETDSVLLFQICEADKKKIKRYGWAVREESSMLLFK